MLLEKANVLSEEIKNVKGAIVAAIVKPEDVMNLDGKSLAALQGLVRLMNAYEEYYIAEAETLLKIESKMDAILMKK